MSSYSLGMTLFMGDDESLHTFHIGLFGASGAMLFADRVSDLPEEFRGDLAFGFSGLEYDS